MKIILLLFLLSHSFPLLANDKKFNAWKAKIIDRFSKKGISRKFLIKEFKTVSYLPEVIEKDRNQVTSNPNIEYPGWIEKWVNTTPNRIDAGKELLKKHSVLLQKIEKKYKVDKEVIVALWGVETLYGKIVGDYDIISSLSTLAYDRRRRKFFERELLAALITLEKGHATRENFVGSWAGATGQCQFMPTNIKAYAQDFDGDGKKDIWTNMGDIFASIAYFLKKAHWKKGKSIGLLTKKTRKVRFSYKKSRTPEQYNKLGLRTWNGSKISGSWRRIIATVPQKNSPLILRGTNYKPLMRWNKSGLFAALNITLMNGFKSD